MHDLTGIRDEFGPEFEILRVLGRGGVSVVYLARDRMLGRSVAIKVIDDRYLADAEALARFRREARLLAQLQHPCIVPVHAARRMADGRVALVMQHMEGPTLRELIRREGPLPFARAEQILRDVADALGYLHRRGVVHRDVKPENIYVEPDGSRAFLADFGIARPLDGDSGLTLTGVVLGTPTYMSPEQIDGAWLNGQSDLYSLGLVGWETLTGRRPWGGETLYTVIYKQKHEYLPLLEQLRPGIPEHLREAVERALLKDRALRWPSAEVFLQQLGGPAPALPAAADGAAPLAALPAPGVPEEDELTRVMRVPHVPAAVPVPAPVHLPALVHAPAPVPVEVEEVWRETTATVEQRTHVRRRRTAVLATAAALTLGGLTAGAALFATISDRDPFVAFAPTAEPAAPAAARPEAALAAPAALPAAAPARDPAPSASPPAGAAGAPAPDPAPAETTRRAERPAAESPRRRDRRTAAESARRRRPPPRPRAAQARPPASSVPAVQEPAPEPRRAG
ncbi:MAG TPA: serine/threonine-protein kinase, partial [Longimicrobiaceae bacterium]